jgi:hypothetical protein
MAHMLVLKRDRRTGALQMLVEIDKRPQAAWTPGPLPEPFRAGEPSSVDGEDAQWFKDQVLRYVDSDPETFPEVDWRGLGQELDDYVARTS